MYPSPYILPAATPVTIDGLVAGSSIKILTIDGVLVREVHTPGGRIAYWDGKNERGEFVSSAVYIVVAYSEDGSKVATGKIAVIHR
jgi:flagellar hook assembly protein FlgD